MWEKFKKRLKRKLGLENKKKRSERKRVLNLRKNRLTDSDRWLQKTNLQEVWNERTAILAEAIKPDATIIEFGAGTDFLKNSLSREIIYQASDIVKRNPDTLVYDLNDKPFTLDISLYDTVLLSGVLEYIYDIDYIFSVFRQNHIKNIYFSYACADICRQDRLVNGWLSDYTLSQIKSILLKNDFKLSALKTWKDQNLFFVSA